jgi:hypothetical protein
MGRDETVTTTMMTKTTKTMANNNDNENDGQRQRDKEGTTMRGTPDGHSEGDRHDMNDNEATQDDRDDDEATQDDDNNLVPSTATALQWPTTTAPPMPPP